MVQDCMVLKPNVSGIYSFKEFYGCEISPAYGINVHTNKKKVTAP